MSTVNLLFFAADTRRLRPTGSRTVPPSDFCAFPSFPGTRPAGRARSSCIERGPRVVEAQGAPRASRATLWRSSNVAHHRSRLRRRTGAEPMVGSMVHLPLHAHWHGRAVPVRRRCVPHTGFGKRAVKRATTHRSRCVTCRQRGARQPTGSGRSFCLEGRRSGRQHAQPLFFCCSFVLSRVRAGWISRATIATDRVTECQSIGVSRHEARARLGKMLRLETPRRPYACLSIAEVRPADRRWNRPARGHRFQSHFMSDFCLA